ncbi:MAG TPA: ABC transporter permease [Thermoleophilia bacterium]|nr:ABC transporter permease [Thermoleophilia bacterium]HQG53893.1 ABC transporter permease [Thermoleophilia bacterium]HQJ97468.1 ABC transporter permease [Thermoleophilia bacterium]
MDRRRYFARKIANALLTVVLVASFNFILFRILPGDPARLLLPKGKQPPEAVEKQRKAFNLDKPLWQQFIYYWGDTLGGEFGMSFSEKRPVSEVVVERIWPTVVLVGVGTIFATIIGMISGVFAGWRRNGTFDVVTTNLGMVFYSMPTFWFGLLMIMLFSTELRWFPTGRMEEPGADLQGWAQLMSLAKHLFLPAFTFAIAYVGEYHLIMRSSITGVMNEDFTLTARAKGLSDTQVLWKHVVPNAMLPTVTIVMMNIGFVMSGAILSETVFNWPGLGLLSYEAMQKRDYPVMQAVFLLASVAVILANLIADIMYYYLDPRVKS